MSIIDWADRHPGTICLWALVVWTVLSVAELVIIARASKGRK